MSDIQNVPVGVTISEPDHPLMVVIGLVRTDDSEVVLKVEARGFEESDAGAIDLADALGAIADSIRLRLARQLVQQKQKQKPKPKRPRFNPQPLSKQGGK